MSPDFEKTQTMNIALPLLLLSLAGVYSQTVPYASFKGNNLVDHDYVDLNQIGDDPSGANSLQCHTDLAECCSATEGSHRADWHFPNGNRPSISKELNDIYQSRTAQTVRLHRANNVTLTPGIYRCDIPTNAVNDENDQLVRESVFVGVYSTSEGNKCPCSCIDNDIS